MPARDPNRPGPWAVVAGARRRPVRATRRLRKAWCCARRRLWRRSLLRHGVAAATEHRAVVAHLRPDLVLDVGANRGQFTLLVKGLLPAARVVAFEPVERAAAMLRTVTEGLGGVTVVVAACGRRAGVADLHVARDDDNSSLLSPTARQVGLEPGAATAATVTVEVSPLDDLVDPALLTGVSLLKVDVQGTEADVLAGATGLLARLDYVYVELSLVERYAGQAPPAEIVDQLGRAGFRLLHLHNPVATAAGLLQVDALFGRAGSGSWSPLLEAGWRWPASPP